MKCENIKIYKINQVYLEDLNPCIKEWLQYNHCLFTDMVILVDADNPIYLIINNELIHKMESDLKESISVEVFADFKERLG